MTLYLTFNIYSILIEIFFLFGSLLLLLFGVIWSTNYNSGYTLVNKSVQFLFLQILILGLILSFKQKSIYLITWNNLLIFNTFALYSKIIILVLTLCWFSISLICIKREKIYNFEYWVLILVTLISLFLILQTYDILSAYLSIELLSLILYILASFKRTSEFSTEAGLKYFILGAFSSSLLLFGFSILYSITGLTNFNDLYLFFINIELLSNLNYYKVLYLGLSFILIALLFKLNVAPFHMWAPDVYEGSPSAVTAFFALIPKFAILSLILKLVIIIFYDLVNYWSYLIIFSVIASSIVGTFSAFAQIKWKRFIVYSSISHFGFMLLAIISNDLYSLNYLFIYLFIYLIMTLGFFSFFINYNYLKFPLIYQARYLNSLSSTLHLNSLLALSLGIILFSMAGIPPFAGFFIKFFIISSAIKYKMFTLVFVVLLCNCISCFYYIRLIKLLYFNVYLPKFFHVIVPLTKANAFIFGFCVLIIVLFCFDFELIVLLTNLLIFSFI